MYAIIETGGKQVRVEVGSKIYVEKLEAEVGSTITIDKVLLVGDKSVKVGTPYVEGAKVTAKVEKQGLGKKSASSNTRAKVMNTRPLVIVNLTLA